VISKAPSIMTVAVVIPIYNSGTSAITAVRSVLLQTYKCKEIIIVDDGSTDDSVSEISKIFFEHTNIKVYSIKNCGAAGARNFGISKVTSDYVAFLDSDDCWFPEKIKIQIDELVCDQSIQLIGSLTNMQNFRSGLFKSTERLAVIPLRTLLFKNYFQTSSVVISIDVLREVGCFPEGRRYAEEGDLFMRVAARYKCVLLNQIMVDYAGGKKGFGSSGLSANLWRMEQGELSNIFGVFRRRECGLLLIILALAISILKFFRRVFIRFSWQIFRTQ
jgi:glycosyltransferase involved in cell wall biosynthesis